jgi:excisionase family DNA binding protein
MDSKMTLTVPQAAALLGISRALAYELVSRCELPALRLGRRLTIRPFATELHEVGPEYGLPHPGAPRTAESHTAEPHAAPTDPRKDEQPEDHNRPHRPAADPVGRNQLALQACRPDVSPKQCRTFELERSPQRTSLSAIDSDDDVGNVVV